MIRRLLLTLCLLGGVPAAAQQAVHQSGNVTPGHAVQWTTNGVVQDAGTAASGSLSSLGVTNNGGPGVCVNSGPITGPYNQLCLSANTSSAARVTLQNYGGAGAQALEFDVNGTITSLPSGTVTGNTQIFDSRAAAAATSIGASVTTVYLNGYATPGDGGQGALYVHSSDSPCTNSWNFSSVDGQCWGLKQNQSLTPEMFGAKGDNTTDDTTAFQNLCDTVQHGISHTVNHSAGKTYVVWPVSNPPSGTQRMCDWSGISGVTWNFNGSPINIPYTTAISGTVFYMSGVSNITINGMTGTSTRGKDLTIGVYWALGVGTNTNIRVNNASITGGVVGLQATRNIGTGTPGQGFSLTGACTDVAYCFAMTGQDNLYANVTTNNAARSVISYNAVGFTYLVNSKNNTIDDVAVEVSGAAAEAAIGGNRTGDGYVRYTNRHSTSVFGASLSFSHQQAAGESGIATTIENVTVDLDVDYKGFVGTAALDTNCYQNNSPTVIGDPGCSDKNIIIRGNLRNGPETNFTIQPYVNGYQGTVTGSYVLQNINAPEVTDPMSIGFQPDVVLQNVYMPLANKPYVDQQETATIGGTITAGDTLSVQFTSGTIVGSPVTVTYTTQAGDTTATAMAGLVAAIQANTAIQNAGFRAYVSGTVATVGQIFITGNITVSYSCSVGGAATETLSCAAPTKYPYSISSYATTNANTAVGIGGPYQGQTRFWPAPVITGVGDQGTIIVDNNGSVAWWDSAGVQAGKAVSTTTEFDAFAGVSHTLKLGSNGTTSWQVNATTGNFEPTVSGAASLGSSGSRVGGVLANTADITGATTTGGNISTTFNQNGSTYHSVTNTTAGTAANAIFSATTDAGVVQYGARSSATTVYKNLAASSAYMYGAMAGGFHFLADNVAGVIDFAAGGGSTAQVTIGTSGQVTTTSGLISKVRTVTAAGAVTVAVTDYFICVNKTVGAATTANLMATPATGTRIIIKDCKGDANVNNITVTPAAGNIDGAGTAVINVAYGKWAGIYNGASWSTLVLN